MFSKFYEWLGLKIYLYHQCSVHSNFQFQNVIRNALALPLWRPNHGISSYERTECEE
jgi:hypothetical protein